MVGLDRRPLGPHGPGGQGARLEVYLVIGEGPWGVAMVLVADDVGEVLLDAASINHVEDLHPAADTEGGHTASDGRAYKGELVGVSLLLHGSRLGVGFLAVEIRVHVACASGDDQGVDDIEYPVGIFRVFRVWEQQYRTPAGPLHGPRVVRWAHKGGNPAPGAVAHALGRRGDTYGRPRARTPHRRSKFL